MNIFSWFKRRKRMLEKELQDIVEKQSKEFWEKAAKERRVFAKNIPGGGIHAMVPAAVPNNCAMGKANCELWPICAGFDGMCHAEKRGA